jgi:hypothetical protein
VHMHQAAAALSTTISHAIANLQHGSSSRRWLSEMHQLCAPARTGGRVAQGQILDKGRRRVTSATPPANLWIRSSSSSSSRRAQSWPHSVCANTVAGAGSVLENQLAAAQRVGPGPAARLADPWTQRITATTSSGSRAQSQPHTARTNMAAGEVSAHYV